MTCQTCEALGFTCLTCKALPPCPPERGHEGRCICGAKLRRSPSAWYCSSCGSEWPDRRVAQR